MITLKQAEAFFWIVKLGSFEAAATKLNTTQSAISKRIQELESSFKLALFDRRQRSAKLTEKGEELIGYVNDLLEKADSLVERMSSNEVLIKSLRIGVTEITALTWLPKLIDQLRQTYPNVQIEAFIELTSKLHDKLVNNQYDLIIVPDSIDDTNLVSIPLGELKNAWMCSPKIHSSKKPISLQEMVQRYPIFTQGMNSGAGAIYDRWLNQLKVKLNNIIRSDSLLAQVGLALSAIGVCYLPVDCLDYLIKQKKLHVINTVPELPPIRYCIIFRKDRCYGLNQQVALLAKECCDFSTLIL